MVEMEMEEMDLLEYWEIIVRRRWMILGLFVAAVVIALVLSLSMEPVYEATTTLMVQEQSSTAQALLFDSLGALPRNATQNYVEILKSRRILDQVKAEVGMDEVTQTWILDRLTIQTVQGTDILRVSMQSTDPQQAQRFVNALADKFIEWNRDTRREEMRSAREFIEAQLVTVSAELTRAEEALLSYREEERALAPSAETVAKLEQIAKLEAQLADVQISRSEINERVLQVRRQLQNQDETLLSSTTIANNPLVMEYQTRLVDLEIRLSGARERYTANHPEILALNAEIEDVRSKLSQQVERIVSTETHSRNPIHQQLYGSLVSLEVELLALNSREEALKSILAREEQALSTLPNKELELARLMRDTRVLEEIYVMLMQRNEETRIAEAMQTASVQVVDYAVEPKSPIKPRIKLNMAIAGVLGIFIGVGLAFLLAFVDNTIKTKEEVETLLGLPVLAQIPDLTRVVPSYGKRHARRE